MTDIQKQSKDQELLQELAESFAERCRRGERPAIGEYAEKHPELSSRIRAVLSAVLELENLKSAAAQVDSSSVPRSSSDLQKETIHRTAGTLSVMGLLQDILDEPPEVQLRDRDAEAAPEPGKIAEGVNKYHVSGVIGSGGMGTVLKAFDGDLRRWVAMKVVRPEVARSKEHLGRFIEEAQICGQLEHPNIPPVHEMGVDQQSHVYFTMKLVKGRTLHEIARDLSLGRPEVRREFTPIRLAQIVQQAAMGVHYANVRGVVHRDLKPENIMVGDYGEVLVMDWGLAKVIGEESSVQLFGEDLVMTARTESGLHTLAGVVQGTPSYMSPEQARGQLDRIDARTDVFGLGAVLYELLCYQPPYRGRTVQEILDLARTGTPPPPSRVAPKRTFIPADLEAICVKALAAEREDRYADAREFQQDLQSYIEGTRERETRRAQAQALAAEGRKHITLYRDLEEKRERRQAEAKIAAEKIAPHEPVEKKKILWEIQDSIDKLRIDAAQCFSRARAALDAAIQTDPDCQDARRALADLYWERFLDAEARRDPRDSAFYRDLVTAHDDGRYAERLKGDGTLAIDSSPPRAEAILYRYVLENRVLVPSDPQPLGSTPIGPIPLPMGSYVLVLQKDGYRETRYPVFVGRSESHRGRVALYTDEEIGRDFIHVPAGEFLRGGDPESYGGAERARVHVDDFFIARFPVTLGEYCEFLDALAARGEDVKDHLPQQTDEVYAELGPGGRYRPAARFFDQSDIRRRYPSGFERGCPVFAVNWHSAAAYVRWRSEVDGREYSLPPEDAWEKAARGTDGRFHAWGDAFDWTFAKGGLSRPERSQPEPVGTFAADESPYGVRDLTGTIREWTSSWFDEKAGTRVVRGGSWNLTVERHFRAATRFGYAPGARVSTFGFRLFSWKKAGGP
jgi:serine/threonine-protein kinase